MRTSTGIILTRHGRNQAFRIPTHSTFMIDLSWYGSGGVVFKYSLVESTETIRMAWKKTSSAKAKKLS